ncbi:hypothetical protein ASPWEDRAFT_111448 [Aspergillus wentii DTO 134E9]|uniref:LicD/FKTN/FKRP nucleotidyltransferase domain-containing protein n=1 Tax=Aspergillus wentii DTO 134E9 TaxID=1073089 RepID=A0A1L9RJX3_ASPWE|nr:uncharacterized protein ASPWEDRAFT_111448 [Aspergillus wentii DTO 134E9]OJJ35232.1 hypothetical protein ASPWEDRAFT_111448 [Aspergillus wentii DTO 134E9]
MDDHLWQEYGLNTSAEYKYFYEPGSNDTLGHYDARFFNGILDDEKKAEVITRMVRAYLNFFDENGLETWIAHGSLLGWWWNGKMLPWDWDVDTQVSDTTLIHLADLFNQTVVEYSAADSSVKSKYLLDINPWARNHETGLGLNIIDARWIDIGSGLYVDITGLRRTIPEEPYIWQCKNFHRYRTEDLFPLRKTTFEGSSAHVPFRYDAVLIEEYNETAWVATKFHNHTWYPDRAEWVRNGCRNAAG